MITDEFKICSLCKIVKTKDEFHKRTNRKSGLHSRCKLCIRECFKKYEGLKPRKKYKIDREIAADKNLKLNYGIGLKDYYTMLKAQHNTCKICSGPALGKGKYHVDHCHKTGKIRGLLCHKCNVALGMVQDSTEHLKKLIHYLEVS